LTSTHDFEQSFYVRDQVNRLTRFSEDGNEIFRPLPLGDILREIHGRYSMNFGRLQLDINHAFRKHDLHAIIGAELREYRTTNSGVTFYGYNPETRINQNAAIDFSANHPILYSNGTTRIPTGISASATIDRNISYYFNASYQ